MPCVSAAEDPAAQARELVEQLRDGDYEVRRKAADKLAALGETARDVLEQAARADDVETRAEAALLLKRLATASLSLLVFDRDGRPASGAEAELNLNTPQARFDGEGQPPRNVTVSADGTASIAGLSPGEYGMYFNWQQRFMTQECSPCWSLHLIRGANPLFITLAKNGAAEVAVQDAGGAPLKGARIQLFSDARFTPELLDLQVALGEHWGQSALAGIAEADGVARAEAAEGTYQSVVQAYGFQPCLAGTVRLAEGQTARLPAVKLEKKNAGQLHLTLLKSNGEPLKKGRVNVLLEYQYAGPEAARLQREARRLKTQLSMWGRGDQLETDEQGKATLEDLRPGNYTLTVIQPYADEAPWKVPEFAIETGQGRELAPLKPCAVGSIEGRIRGTDNKGLRYSSVYAVAEEELADSYPSPDDSYNWQFRIQQRFGVGRRSQSQENGRYTLKNLVSGRYAVCIVTSGGQQILIFGQEVTAGQTTKAPDAVLPAAAALIAHEIKGTVFLPSGKPAERARVNLYHENGGSSGNVCDEKGSFHFSDQGAFGGHLIVKASECRPLCLDVSTPGLQLDNLALRLEKQDYGRLRAKVVDEAGKPLSGVTMLLCGPSRLRNYYRGGREERQFVTNANGEVRLSGLAVGERGLRVQYEGYSPPENCKAVITPDAETQATFVLRKGLQLSGRIEAPEGSVFSQAVVCLLGQSNRTSRVSAEGCFTFAGLAAGTYFVTAQAPGLIAAGQVKVALSPDAAPQEQCVKLVRPCGVAIAVDKRFEGWSAVLVPVGKGGEAGALPAWATLSGVFARAGRFQSYARVDSAGGAEFWGVGPGKYDVLLSPGVDRFGQVFSAQQSRGPATARMQLVAGPVEACPLKSVAELPALPHIALKTAAGSASVSGRLFCPKAPAEARDSLAARNARISLVGREAIGRIDFGNLSALGRAARPAKGPLIIGTPPPALAQLDKLRNEPGAFVFSDVPPGEYKLVAEVNRFLVDYRGIGEEEASPPVVLTAIVVPADAHLDLGKLEYDLPLPASRPDDAVNDWREMPWRSEAEPEDQIPIFQP